ncbi:hypothetical protein GUITHDRAFT_101494 [Guillardia theta CCMP2712]|uniref:non-specific serine/threonine protein kinase n=1 Tax=Guillardia theta (strain CCMP2712) TaxID=905079 RepID=L1JXW0_GUITC|nr:hypothetical protein GUITHDRAFT_101494 [Guillardia theta CCMP2712]EKX53050.1 hypothetical protein GUITHDRAFT_101494 [Guillardia theta CCMP2712]|eukprot:XP_005840030.1 hypothetical protein GUITHDRAFT_101494 [Guillardia theta CCMP2712]
MQEYDEEFAIGSNVVVAKGRMDHQRYAIKKCDSLFKHSREMNLKLAYTIQEARIFLHVKHPNLVRVFDFFTDGPCFCVVLEYCSLGTLRHQVDHAMKHQLQLSEPTLWRWMTEILLGVSFLHKMRIVHRDLKPENVFLAGSQLPGTIKVGDLGSARIMKGGETALKTNFVGTEGYAAPEIHQSQPYDERVDLWSLGIVCIELACLKRPSERSLSSSGFLEKTFSPYPRGAG